MLFSEERTCPNCGGHPHLFQGHCPRNLHGTDDPYKTSCATCETVIPSGGDRVGDKFGNLYCSHECQAAGLEALVDLVDEEQGGGGASA